MRIEWISDLHEIERLRDTWTQFEVELPDQTVHSRFDYVIPWYRCYAHTEYTDNGHPLVGLVWEGPRLIAIAPLITSQSTFAKIPVRRAVTTGYNLSAGELLLADPATGAIERIAESLISDWHIELVEINGLGLQSESFMKLRSYLDRERIHFETIDFHWYAVADLEGGYDRYFVSHTKNFRHQTKRIAHKVESCSAVYVERATSPPQEASVDVMDRMFALSEKSWRVRRSGLEAERHHQRFYRELCDRFGRIGTMDLAFLVIDGQDAAFSWGLIDRGIYYHTLIAYDETFAELSPGTYLLQQIFKYLPDMGIERMVSHGPYEYKRRWASRVHPQHTICVFGSDLKARLAHWVSQHWVHRHPST